MAKSVLFGASQIRFTPRNPRRDGYEEAQGYDRGKRPSVAINATNDVVQVHQGESSSSLNLLFGRVEGTSLEFRNPHHPVVLSSTGNYPSVALNSNIVLLMFDQNNRLRYKTGILTANAATKTFKVDFHPSREIADQVDSTNVSVAMNRDGVAIEVHQQGSNVYWRRGKVKLVDQTVTWSAATLLATGSRPSVAINNSGEAVAVFSTSAGLRYAVGTFAREAEITSPITWTVATDTYAPGASPSVAITDDGDVFVVHASGTDLIEGVGKISGTSIAFIDVLDAQRTFYKYDSNGHDPRVATNGKVAVQVSVSGSNTLAGSSCLFFDHANWMHDHRAQLRTKALTATALPASHDTGAILDTLARTQDLNVFGQLMYGVRYFDIRPRYFGPSSPIDVSKIFTYHDIPSGYYNGESLADVIRDVREFMQTHNELVILKISHFSAFSSAIWNVLAGAFLDTDTGLKTWLLPKDAAAGRLADRKIDQYVKETQGTVLIVVDLDGDVDYVTEAQNNDGLYRYRDWNAAQPETGDITVFDMFSSTPDFDTMALSTSVASTLPGTTQIVKRGQLHKFDWFDGKCLDRTTVCDLFLLSWTVTPNTPGTDGTPFVNAAKANRNLASYLNIPLYKGASRKRMHINLLYTDAVEYSRSTDVAMVRNGLVP